jgi:hypothetical protein
VPDVTFSHDESLTAFQANPLTAVCTVRLPEPPAPDNVTLDGVMVTGAVIDDVALIVSLVSVTELL